VDALEQGGWSRCGGHVIIPRLRRYDTANIDPRQHEDILPRSMCHNDMCHAACSELVHRLIKPR
jgi:hypothetical protein